MLENLLTPPDCDRRINLHILVYDNFATNVESNSSAESLNQFLLAVFEPVGQAFYSEFGVGLEVHYVNNDTICSIAEDPPVKEEEKEEMRRIYAESNREKQISYNMIMYDFSLEDEERPHFIIALVGEEKIVPAGIDLFTWPMYLGARPHAGSSGERYCTVGINVVNGLSYTTLHELGHSLGAEHTNERGCIMQPSMVHGRKTYGWSKQNRDVVERKLRELGILQASESERKTA